MKLKEKAKERKIKQKELGAAVGYDESEISKIFHGRLLPTPAKMGAICKALDCGVLDIYERREVDLLPKAEKQARVKNSRGYNLCVFIPEAYRYELPAAVSAAGHKTFYDWLKPFIEETIRKYKNGRNMK